MCALLSWDVAFRGILRFVFGGRTHTHGRVC